MDIVAQEDGSGIARVLHELVGITLKCRTLDFSVVDPTDENEHSCDGLLYALSSSMCIPGGVVRLWFKCMTFKPQHFARFAALFPTVQNIFLVRCSFGPERLVECVQEFSQLTGIDIFLKHDNRGEDDVVSFFEGILDACSAIEVMRKGCNQGLSLCFRDTGLTSKTTLATLKRMHAIWKECFGWNYDWRKLTVIVCEH